MTLLVVVGPTASGKTDLALQLASQRQGEIVSADSVQVYRHFDVGTSKPDAAQKARARHHLVDCIDPLEPMDAARWVELAESAIADIRARGKTPVVCGGTFLYIKALLFGLAMAPPADETVRQRHRDLVTSQGPAALHTELGRVDPPSAARLNPNDQVRVSRALEVFELTGIPMSEWQARHGFSRPRHDARLVGIAWPRADLDRRIKERTKSMLARGWTSEVEHLLREGYGSARAMQSVGYRQIADALGSGQPADPLVLQDVIVRKTRIFARRQRTWLRDQPVHWLPPETINWVRWQEICV